MLIPPLALFSGGSAKGTENPFEYGKPVPPTLPRLLRQLVSSPGSLLSALNTTGLLVGGLWEVCEGPCLYLCACLLSPKTMKPSAKEA